MENLESLKAKVSEKSEEFTDAGQNFKYENVQASMQHVPSTPTMPNHCPVTNEAKVPEGIAMNQSSNSERYVQLDSLKGNKADITDDRKTFTNNHDVNVNCDGQDREESSDFGMLEKSLSSMKKFNAKYSVLNPSISPHELNPMVSSKDPEGCLLTSYLPTNDTEYATESLPVQDCKGATSHKEAGDQERHTIGMALPNPQYHQSTGLPVTPLSVTNTQEPINSLYSLSNNIAIGNALVNNGTVSCLSNPQGCTASIPGSSLPAMLGYSHVYDSNGIPCMLIMSGTFNTAITVPIYGSLCPFYIDPRQHLGLTAQLGTHYASNTEQSSIQNQTWPSTLMCPSNTSCLNSKMRTVSMLSFPSPIQSHPSTGSAATPQAVTTYDKHIFKTPKKMITHNDIPAQKTSLAQPKNSTVIRVSPRYSETKGHCSPIVLVSKNVAPLQPIRGNVQQYVITQGHDKHLPKNHQAQVGKKSENQPIYLKGTPPQGYRRRLLASGKSKHTRSKKIARKGTVSKCTSWNSAEHLPMIPTTQNKDTIQTIIIPEPERIHPSMKEDEVHQVPQSTSSYNQTPVKCVNLQTPNKEAAVGTLCNKSKPPCSTKTTPKPNKHTAKSKKTPRVRSRPKTPRVEDKDRKRERDHRNCVEIREAIEQLCGVLPGSQRSWSRLHILDFTVEYIKEMIEKLEGLGVSRFDVCKETISEEQETPVVTDSPTIECLQSSENLNETTSEYSTSNGKVKRQWIKLSDITKTIAGNESLTIEENPQEELMGDVFVVEVPTDSDSNSLLDSALIMNSIPEEDELLPSRSQVGVVEQRCPQDDHERAIHECCEQLLELQNQLVPGTPSDYNQTVQESDDTTVQNIGDLTVSPDRGSFSPEYSVLSQHTNEAQYITGPSWTGLLSSQVIIVPQITDEENGDRFPDTMSPFIVPSSPEEVLHMFRGISNPISTEDLSQSPNSQDNSTCTPCGVMSDDPLSYVSPFATPKLGFSPTFAELSPGHTVSENECFHLESPIHSGPVCQTTDFSEVGLTTIAASIEVVSTIEPQVNSKTKSRKRRTKVQHGFTSESPIINQSKTSSKKLKSHPKSQTKSVKHDTKNTTPCLNTDRPTRDPLKDQDSFKTPSPTNRCGKLKRMKTTLSTPSATIPRKKSRKQPKVKKSVCKRQLINFK